MTYRFIERVIKESIVDTRKYRYIVKDGNIMRLPINYLDTTAVIDGWEVVYTLYNGRRKVK